MREEILRIVDYWIAFGVSGFRLDAAPLIIADKGLEHANPRDATDAQVPTFVRMRVEAAMLEMIGRLLAEGLSQQAVALALADAAEDYVIRLASKRERTYSSL